MIRRIIITVLVLCVLSSIAIKVVFHFGSQNSTAVYFPPLEKSAQSFVISGMEMCLPWSKIDGVFADQNLVLFQTEGSGKFTVQRLMTAAESAEFMKQLNNALSEASAYKKLRNKVLGFFLGDLGELMKHPERVGQLRVPWRSRVTWRSNPLSDARISVGLLLRRYQGGVDETYQVENSYMRGYHDRVHLDHSTKVVHFYTLGMKDGRRNVIIMMHEGTEDLTAPLLSSIHVIKVSKDLARLAFDRSKQLAQASHGNVATQKLALLFAIEAASNGTPHLAYYIHVLDLCRRYRWAKLGNAWLGSAMHYFPASKSDLEVRFSELIERSRIERDQVPQSK
jgi:hypothetical protein